MWNGLPAIRKQIASSMINDFGLSQKETAQKLEITPAAVCQYLSKKRGKIEIYDGDVRDEIKLSAKKIIDKGNGSIIPETCRICKLLRGSKDFSSFCKMCDD